MTILFILGLLLGAGAIIFAAQNITTITVTFLAWQFEGSLALILALAVVAGMLICAFLSLPDVLKKRFVISDLQDANDQLKEELMNKETEVANEKAKLENK